MLEKDCRLDLTRHNGTVLAKRDPMHLHDVAVLRSDEVRLSWIAIASDNHIL